MNTIREGRTEEGGGAIGALALPTLNYTPLTMRVKDFELLLNRRYCMTKRSWCVKMDKTVKYSK